MSDMSESIELDAGDEKSSMWTRPVRSVRTRTIVHRWDRLPEGSQRDAAHDHIRRGLEHSPSRQHHEERITVSAEDIEHVPVTFEHCSHVEGPFFHGTKSALEVGGQLVPGQRSNYHEGRTSNNIYFSALLETAVWGAELATALAGSGERGHIYVVEPTGPFEDDPNVTNKRFPGNITKSYRTRQPLRIVAEVRTWHGHPPDVLDEMLDNIERLREQGLDVIED